MRMTMEMSRIKQATREYALFRHRWTQKVKTYVMREVIDVLSTSRVQSVTLRYGVRRIGKLNRETNAVTFTLFDRTEYHDKR